MYRSIYIGRCVILYVIACIKNYYFIQVTSGPEAEPPILKREPNPQVS